MVVSSRLLEASGAVPVFISRKQPVPYVFLAMPGSKQAWPKSAACWSPAIPAIGIECAPSVATGASGPSDDGTTCGSTARGMRSRSSMKSSQLGARDVEQQGAAGIGDVGHVPLAVRQLPHQPAVDRAESEFAAFRALTCSRHVIEQPGQLGAREIRIEQQSGAPGDLGLETVGLQLLAQVGRAAVLPDDGRRNRPAGAAVPQHGRLTLVGDADRRHVRRRRTRSRQHFGDRRSLRRPDLLRIVLDPAGARKVLREFALCRRHRHAGAVEQDRPRAGGALVEREDELRHGRTCGDESRF